MTNFNMLFTSLLAVNGETIAQGLDLLWKGMLAIMVVLLIICLATFAINKISAKLQDKKDLKNAEGSANDTTDNKTD